MNSGIIIGSPIDHTGSHCVIYIGFRVLLCAPSLDQTSQGYKDINLKNKWEGTMYRIPYY